MRRSLQIILVGLLVCCVSATERWSEEKANKWYEQVGWRVGCNFIPSTAVNQLEMWQAETFDPVTIQRELALAHGLGFNTLRVFLHYLAWGEDQTGFKQRMHQFLNMTEEFGLKTSFVLFDDCWKNDPHIGQQPNPIPGVHNSEWVQCPGNAEPVYGSYQLYVSDILTEFANDERVIYWDLYNEPGNSQHFNKRLPLLTEVFSYARQVNVTQPVTAGLWCQDAKLNKFQLENSDIITFHRYSIPAILEVEIKLLKSHNRPVICTEYMARTIGSTFENSLPVFKKYNVGAINWGLVFGKTQTIFPWGSPEGAPIPKTWFHDIFWPNATCFRESECSFIRNITSTTSVSVY